VHGRGRRQQPAARGIALRELAGELGDGRGEALGHQPTGTGQPLAFGGALVLHLAAAGDQRRQLAQRAGGQRPGRKGNGRRERRQHAGVHAGGLGEDALAPGVVARLAGMDHQHGQARRLQRQGTGGFIASGRFQHDAPGRQRYELGAPARDARGGVGQALRPALLVDGAVQVLRAHGNRDGACHGASGGAGPGWHSCVPTLPMRACWPRPRSG
jgi:hypothetical protein